MTGPVTPARLCLYEAATGRAASRRPASRPRQDGSTILAGHSFSGMIVTEAGVRPNGPRARLCDGASAGCWRRFARPWPRRLRRRRPIRLRRGSAQRGDFLLDFDGDLPEAKSGREAQKRIECPLWTLGKNVRQPNVEVSDTKDTSQYLIGPSLAAIDQGAGPTGRSARAVRPDRRRRPFPCSHRNLGGRARRCAWSACSFR
jgi:hypothetical protein